MLSYLRYPRARDQQGFTFTELLIVLSVLAVVILLAGSWLSAQIPKVQLNGVVRQVRGDLMGARMQAVSQGNEFRVLFEDPYHYAILDDENNNGQADPGEQIEKRSVKEEYAGVMIRSNRNPIFHPRGTASSFGTIRVSSPAGEKAITVSMTGRVRIKSSQ